MTTAEAHWDKMGPSFIPVRLCVSPVLGAPVFSLFPITACEGFLLCACGSVLEEFSYFAGVVRFLFGPQFPRFRRGCVCRSKAHHDLCRHLVCSTGLVPCILRCSAWCQLLFWWTFRHPCCSRSPRERVVPRVVVWRRLPVQSPHRSHCSLKDREFKTRESRVPLGGASWALHVFVSHVYN